MYNKFHQLVDQLIELNHVKRIRERILRGIPDDIYLLSYLKEFCTIRVDIGRRTGKTSYIIKRANENSLVIVCNQKEKNRLLGTLKNDTNIVTYSEVETHRFRGHNKVYDFIFIDDIDAINLFLIYNTFGKDKSQTFVIFGNVNHNRES